jgi:predicted AlkP superfamily phosphohydrolase/phosphomutase
MSSGKGSGVLAIGIDAAEATLVRQLIEQGEMPALRELLKNGRWLRVDSPAHIGSGAVWPTFMTGVEPTAHGMYSEWSWRPETMSLTRYHGRHLKSFWEPLARQNVSIGIFDVPFALPVGLSAGFEVCEWWAHDTTGAGLQSGPAEILPLVEQSPAHPLSANRFVDTTPDSKSDLKELTAACVEGVRRRGALAQNLIRETAPRLSLLVFPEIHHASHLMWHTIDPGNKIYEHHGLNNGSPEPLLKEVYRAVDQELGGLIDLAGSEAKIFVFALHGMRPALGFPAFLGPALCEQGFSRLASWSSQSWPERALSMFGATKRHTPEAVKRLYYKLTPTSTTHKLAQPTMLPAYDWANTCAFSLPTDQYGWIRVNLAGREAQGSVPLARYDDTCQQLEKFLLGLFNDHGEPLVKDIHRTSLNTEAALHNLLPDLVVHWQDAAFEWPVRIKNSKVQVEPVGKKATGQHASEGFCISRNGDAQCLSGVVAAKDLGRLFTANLKEPEERGRL